MNLRILDQPISPSSCGEPSTCESCGEPFTCGAQLSGCWCAEVEVSEDVRAELRRRFQRCLCRPCLERFAGNESALRAPDAAGEPPS